MTWFKVDDKLHDHRKARAAGAAAMGVWVLAGSWAADNLTDGFVPATILPRWGRPRDATRLVEVGLWHADEQDGETGWRFHEWHLARRIRDNGGNPKPGKKWHDAARLMLDNDGRTEADIHAAIDWCQADEFWRANILSMPKLREKYDQLRLQAQRRAGPVSRRQQETDDLFNRAAIRMGVIQGGQS
jgi:hypothetical protein